MLNPLTCFLNFHLSLLQGKIKLRMSAAHNPTMPEGYTPFLYVQKRNLPSQTPVRLVAKFSVHSLNLWQKGLLPVLSIPFFAGFPGFIDKTYLINESENSLCGFYTWRSREEAEHYISGYPGRLMAANALPDSLEMEIISLKQ